MRCANPFQSSIAIYIETTHLIGNANQITGFFMKFNSGLNGIKFQKCSRHSSQEDWIIFVRCTITKYVDFWFGLRSFTSQLWNKVQRCFSFANSFLFISFVIKYSIDSKVEHFAVWNNLFFQLFHDGGCYHIETSPLICKANQWTGFYMIGSSVMKELVVRHTYS